MVSKQDVKLTFLQNVARVFLIIWLSQIVLKSIALADSPKTPKVVQIYSDSQINSGEVDLVNSNGKIITRYTGFGLPVHMHMDASADVIVLDQLRAIIIQFDRDGSIIHEWKLPPNCNKAQRFELLENGNILVAAGPYGAFELNKNSDVVWKTPSPAPKSGVTGILRLSDGSTVLTVRFLERGIPILFGVDSSGKSSGALNFNPPQHSRRLTASIATNTERNQMLLWDDSWAEIYKLSFHSLKDITQTVISQSRPYKVSANGRDDLLIIREDFSVALVRNGEEISRFKFLYPPTAAITDAIEGQYFIAFNRLEDAEWPQSYLSKFGSYAFDWDTFYFWCFAAFIGVIKILLFRLKIPNYGIQTKIDEEQQKRVFTTPSGGEILHKIPLMILFGCGLYLAYSNQPGIDSNFISGFPTKYLVGLSIFIVTGLFLIGRGAKDRQIATESLNYSNECKLLFSLVVLVSLLLSALLFIWRSSNVNYVHQVGAWVTSISLLLSVAMPLPNKLRKINFSPTDFALLTIPLLIASFTIFYRLMDVPSYYHFDFTYYILMALHLVEGRIPDIWNFGFVPAPIIGLLPHVAVMEFLGRDPLMFRIGSAVVGVIGIVIIYLLGRFWRDRTTGLLAAVLLAGNISYIHFSRLPTAGEAALISLVVIASYCAAWRKCSPRWWILTGLACGASFYLWPVARVGAITVFLNWTLFLIVSPRRTLRQWYGPLLLIASFVVVITPLVPLWLMSPTSAFPRVQESMLIYDVTSGQINFTALIDSLGTPLMQTINWFFYGADHSSQGSVSPGLNFFESSFFILGLFFLLLRPNFIRITFLVQLTVVFLICGTWADAPPWGTRLLPIMPIACLLIGGVLSELARSVRAFIPIGKQVSLSIVLAATIVCSPIINFKTYLEYEMHRPLNRMGEISLLGKGLHKLPLEKQLFLVITERFDWSLRDGGRLGELIPYILNRKVMEVRDLSSSLPIKTPIPTVFIIQATRVLQDYASIKAVYPNARLEEVKDVNGDLAGAFVHVDNFD